MAQTGRRILVVDDDPDWRSLYRLRFPAEYDLVTAADGMEALER